MSRHRLPAHDSTGGTWTVGYDPAEATYYAQVEPARPAADLTPAERAAFLRTHQAQPGTYADDELLLPVIGDHRGQVRTLEQLRHLLTERGVTLPPDVDGALELERRGTYTAADRRRRPPGTLLADTQAALDLARTAFPPPPPGPAGPTSEGDQNDRGARPTSTARRDDPTPGSPRR